MKGLFSLFFLLFGFAILFGEGGDSDMAFRLRSASFENGGRIPVVYTCDGRDVSPPLSWENSPAGTKSFVLICDDPDAPVGTWVHWVIYNIPPSTKSLPEAVPTDKKLKDGSMQGKNDFGRIGYGGPCPPRGKPHRYFFKLYALDTMLKVDGGLRKKEILGLIKGHVLGEAELYGTYGRS